MALGRFKVWVQETLLATDLNGSFQEIVDYINNNVLGATSHVHDGTDAAKVSYLNLLDKPKDKNFIVFPLTGVMTTGSDKAPLKHEAQENGTIVEVRAVCKTAPTGADLIFDVNIGGSTIWTTQANRIKIAAGATAGNTSTINLPSLAKGSILTVDVDQIGSGVAGSDVTIYVIYQADL